MPNNPADEVMIQRHFAADPRFESGRSRPATSRLMRSALRALVLSANVVRLVSTRSKKILEENDAAGAPSCGNNRRHWTDTEIEVELEQANPAATPSNVDKTKETTT